MFVARFFFLNFLDKCNTCDKSKNIIVVLHHHYRDYCGQHQHHNNEYMHVYNIFIQTYRIIVNALFVLANTCACIHIWENIVISVKEYDVHIHTSMFVYIYLYTYLRFNYIGFCAQVSDTKISLHTNLFYNRKLYR